MCGVPSTNRTTLLTEWSEISFPNMKPRAEHRVTHTAAEGEWRDVTDVNQRRRRKDEGSGSGASNLIYCETDNILLPAPVCTGSTDWDTRSQVRWEMIRVHRNRLNGLVHTHTHTGVERRPERPSGSMMLVTDKLGPRPLNRFGPWMCPRASDRAQRLGTNSIERKTSFIRLTCGSLTVPQLSQVTHRHLVTSPNALTTTSR